MANETTTTAQVTTQAAEVKVDAVAPAKTETTIPTTPATAAANTPVAPVVVAKTDPIAADPNAAPKVKAEEKPVAPEKYDLKLPKDSPLDPAYVAKIEAEAKAEGLTNEQAQVRLERDNQAQAYFANQQQEQIKQQQKAWVTEVESDKEIGGKDYKENIETAKRALDRFADDAFKKTLSESGLGNNPHMIRTFLRIGKMMADDKLVTEGKAGATPASKKSREEVFYPSMQKKQE